MNRSKRERSRKHYFFTRRELQRLCDVWQMQPNPPPEKEKKEFVSPDQIFMLDVKDKIVGFNVRVHTDIDRQSKDKSQQRLRPKKMTQIKQKQKDTN